MLIGDKIIYFELQKTGCSHTRDILSSIPSLNSKIIGKHNTYDSVDSCMLNSFEKKIKVGNIRNPWDWYVSLWAYGCMKKGGLYSRVTQSPKLSFFGDGLKSFYRSSRLIFKKPTNWLEMYSDPNNPVFFREWLKTLIGSKGVDIGEGYKSAKISAHIGLLSFRYIKLYTYEGNSTLPKLIDFDDLYRHDSANNFIDIIIRNESIHADLLNYSTKLGVEENNLASVLNDFSVRTNSSLRKTYQWYYDAETIALVKQKEKLIIEKYGYKFE